MPSGHGTKKGVLFWQVPPHCSKSRPKPKNQAFPRRGANGQMDHKTGGQGGWVTSVALPPRLLRPLGRNDFWIPAVHSQGLRSAMGFCHVPQVLLKRYLFTSHNDFKLAGPVTCLNTFKQPLFNHHMFKLILLKETQVGLP